MVGIDEVFFLEVLDDSKQQVRYAAKVVGVRENLYTAEFDKNLYLDQTSTGGKAFDMDHNIRVFFEKDGRLMQQSARLQSVEQAESGLSVSFESLGDPASAERREHFRVSTALSGLTATLDREEKCRLLDVSFTGFSIIASERHRIGRVIDTSIDYEGERFNGRVSVQSIRELSDDWFRYGLMCIDGIRFAGNITKGLKIMAMAIQRQQLRRLAALG